MMYLSLHNVKSLSNHLGDLIIEGQVVIVNGALRGIKTANPKAPEPMLWIPQNLTPKLTATYRENANCLTFEFGRSLQLNLFLESLDEFYALKEAYADVETRHNSKAA
jgi:hypothetical protein